MRTYLLVGQEVIPCTSYEWAERFEKSDRIVKQDDVGPFWISTVFLGLDHGFEDGPPLLFETMVFEKKDPDREVEEENIDWSSIYMERYSTYQEALEGHEEKVKYIRDILSSAESLAKENSD